MGSLTLPIGGSVYVDAMALIYTVERYPDYWPLLVAAFEQSLTGTDIRLLPITRVILRSAARLRATTKLQAPDAVHAASALDAGCTLFVTNDANFRNLNGLSAVILDDMRTA